MNKEQKQNTIEIDTRGQICPATLLVAMEKMNENKTGLRSGTVILNIKTDNREATNTIPGTARNMGYHVDVIKEAGYYQIKIGKLQLQSDL